MTTDDDRAAYLAGEDRSVPDAQERRALDDIRGVLADPALWKEPGAGLEAEIVAAVNAEARGHVRRLLAVAVAVVVSAAAAITFRSLRGRRTISR